MFSAVTPAAVNRSITSSSTPQVIGLTNPSGGGGEYAELTFRIWATSVGSPGIQFPITIRPPGRVTRTTSFATSNGFGANIAPKMLTTRSKLSSATSLRSDASPSWNLQLVRPRLCARALPASTRSWRYRRRGRSRRASRPARPSSRRHSRGRGRRALGDPQGHDERLATLPHALGDAGEVAFFPECLVRIHALGTLVAREHVEGDRNVFACHRSDHEHVKELVVAKDQRPRIGAAPRIDDGAGRVEEPAGDDEQDGHQGEFQHLREGDDADPAERQADRSGQPFRRAHPAELQDDRQERADPDDPQDRDRPPLRHHEQPERRIAAGDQQVDTRMVEAREPGARAGAPGRSVIDRACPEADSDTAREDRRGDPRLPRVGRDHHHDADRGRRIEAELVKDAPELRLHELLLREHFAHGSCRSRRSASAGARLAAATITNELNAIQKKIAITTPKPP